ncbi:MAG: PKD domain-containing protein, partial [Verrucomicrobiota bacterium]
NTGPSAEAGPVLSVTLPQPATLRGSFADDGLPFPPGVPTFSWTAVSGPGEVAFATPGLPVTQATFSAPGTYVLRFSVADGALTASDTTTVTVAGTVVADLGLVALPGNPVRLRFRAAEGRAYTLRHRPQLEAGSWQTLQEVPAGAARDVEFADPAGEDSRFYQVISGAP